MTRRVTILLAVLSLGMSSLALALQVAQRRSAQQTFSRFTVPARWTEIDLRLLQAQVNIMREYSEIRPGMWAPYTPYLAPSRNEIVVRVPVFAKDLPSGFEDRRYAFQITAIQIVNTVAAQFPEVYAPGRTDLKPDVLVEFVDYDMKRNTLVVIASYSKGELTVK
jgi:hypothetical protein